MTSNILFFAKFQQGLLLGKRIERVTAGLLKTQCSLDPFLWPPPVHPSPWALGRTWKCIAWETALSVGTEFTAIKLNHKSAAVGSMQRAALRKQHTLQDMNHLNIGSLCFSHKFRCEILIGSETECTSFSDLNPESSFICICFPFSIVLTSPTNDLINGENSLVSDHYMPQLLPEIHWTQLLCHR